MIKISSLKEFFKNLFTPGKEEVTLSAEDIEAYFDQTETNSFFVTELALFTAVDLIARTIAKCEFVTVKNNKEFIGDEYYSWNIAPNLHQTKAEFIRKLISTLIFKNEVLIIQMSDGQRFVADGFSKKENFLKDDEFSSVSIGNFSMNKTFLSRDVIYLKHNNFALERLLNSMCRSYESLMKSAEKRYRKSTGHKGILKIDGFASGSNDFEKKLNDLMQNHFKRYFESENAVLPLTEGYDYNEPNIEANKTTNNEINDIQKLKTEAYNTVANALHIPPAIMRGEASQLKDAVDTFIADAIDTITAPLSQAITDKCYGQKQFSKGNYLLIDTTYAKHIDVITSANNIDKAIACGVLIPAKAQKYAGMVPSDEEFAKQHYLTKNYQTAALAVSEEGGENNAE